MFDSIDSKVLKAFEIVKKLGQGAYGQVWKAKSKKTGAVCTLKKICEAFSSPQAAQKTYREVKYL
jgi:serine/threonine protein kinase